MLKSMGEGGILDFILDNWEMELDEEFIKEIEKVEERKDKIEPKDELLNNIEINNFDKKSINSEDTDISYKDLKKGKKITLRKLLSYPKLLEKILGKQKIGDTTLLQLLNPLLELLGKNSLDTILNFKITTGKNEVKTVKELFVEPVMTLMSILSASDKINNADLENMKNLKEKNKIFVTKYGAEIIKTLNEFDEKYAEFKKLVFQQDGTYRSEADLKKCRDNIFVTKDTCISKLRSILTIYEENFDKEELSEKSLPGVLDLLEYMGAITKDKAFVEAAKALKASLAGLSYIGSFVGSFRSYDVMLVLRPNNSFSLHSFLRSRLEGIEETMKMVNCKIGSSKNNEKINDDFMKGSLSRNNI